MPAATDCGVLGIGRLPRSGPEPSSGSRSWGGSPSRIQSRSLASPSVLRSAGMLDRVCFMSVRNCRTSISVAVPTFCCCSAMATSRSCVRRLSSAILIRCWVMRYST